MLIVALVMAVIGLAALVTAVVTSNEVIAWVCIAASVIGVVLLIVDAVRERQQRDATRSGDAEATQPAEEPEADEGEFDEEYPEDTPAEGGSADR
jgi:membrane protein implicated in regulation of membrane protease activity